MDWLQFAQNDWEVYQDKSRIAKYLQFGKISATQYQDITDEPYTE